MPPCRDSRAAYGVGVDRRIHSRFAVVSLNFAFVLQHITVESRFPPPPMLFPHIVLEGRSAPTDQLFLCVRSATVPSLCMIEKMCGIRQPAEVCSCCLRLLKDLDLACRAITVGEQNKEFSLGIQGRDSPRRPQVPRAPCRVIGGCTLDQQTCTYGLTG